MSLYTVASDIFMFSSCACGYWSSFRSEICYNKDNKLITSSESCIFHSATIMVLVLSGIAMSNTVQYIITNIAVYCVITVCTCIYIYTYIKHLKIEIYYIGDRIKAMTLFWRLWRVITSFTISHIII